MVLVGKEDEFSEKKDEFPSLAMVSLCVGVLAHVIVNTSQFSYIAYMVVDIGAADSLDDAGYYSGWISGFCMIGRLISGIPFGMASDRYGRKPCLIISMISLAIFSIVFGCSTNLLTAVASRYLLGFGSGFTGIASTCVTELNKSKKNETKSFGYFNGAYGVASIIGPVIGGMLARPALQYPNTSLNNPLFVRYPYLLPSLCCSFISLLSAIMMFFWLPETRYLNEDDEKEQELDLLSDIEVIPTIMLSNDSKDNNNNKYNSSKNSNISKTGYGSVSQDERIDEYPNGKIDNAPVASTFSILKSNHLSVILYSNVIFQALVAVTYEVFPMWCECSLSSGGLAWDTAEVGTVSSSVGVILVFFQIFLFNRIMKYFSNYSHEVIFISQLMVSGIVLLLIPLGAYLTRSKGEQHDDSFMDIRITQYIVIAAIYGCYCSSVSIGYSTMSMIVNASVSSEIRGTMNGLMNTLLALSKAAALVIGTYSLALFNNMNYFTIKGKMFFVVSSFLYFVLFLCIKDKLE